MRREDRAPAVPMVRVQKKSTGRPQLSPMYPAFLLHWLYGFSARLSPRGPGSFAPVALKRALRHQDLAPSVGLQGPHGLAVR